MMQIDLPASIVAFAGRNWNFSKVSTFPRNRMLFTGRSWQIILQVSTFSRLGRLWIYPLFLVIMSQALPPPTKNTQRACPRLMKNTNLEWRDVYRKVECVCMWFFVNHDIGEARHKSFTFAFITPLPRVKTENSYINQANFKRFGHKLDTGSQGRLCSTTATFSTNREQKTLIPTWHAICVCICAPSWLINWPV
mgnify:CR=1 FL=1